jgi:hypothetical protein
MRRVLIVMTLCSLCGLAGRAQELPRMSQAEVFATFNGPPEKFESLMQAVDRTLAADPDNAAAMLLRGVGRARRSGEAVERKDFAAVADLWQQALADLDRARALAPDNERIIGGRAAFLASVSRQMPESAPRPFLPSVITDFEKVLRQWEAGGFADKSVHQRGELLTGLAEALARTGSTDRAQQYFGRITRELPGTPYADRALQWLDGRPESKDPKFFTCVGCHVQ